MYATVPSEIAVIIFGYFIVTGIIMAIVNIAIAFLINADANELETTRFRPGVAPWIWTMSALFGGIFVVGVYWVMYHSTLRQTTTPQS